MEANELRLGNYVNDGYGLIFELSLDSFRDMRVFDSHLIWKPILLTPEWLLKFGFEQEYGEFQKGDINLDCEYTNKGEWIFFLESIESENVCRYYPKVDIKYVHELQNLHFALTGEELTVNL